MWFTRVSIGNPVFATMTMVALLVLGVFSYQRLNVDQFPDVSFPIVVVATDYPGASPETVEADISRPIEEAVNTVSGIKTVTSRSYEGRSQVIAEFDLVTDPAVAAQDVRDKVAQVKVGFRPEVKEPWISRFRPDDQPIVSIGVSSGGRKLSELTALADQVIVKRLETVRGVGQVSVVGGVQREIKIVLDPHRMKSLGIGVDQVLATLARENQELPAGSIETERSETLVKVRGRIKEPREFGRLIVATRGGAPVRIEQFAEVRDGVQDESSAALVDGRRALSIDIVKVQGANTIAVANGVNATVAELKARLPADVALEVVRDSSVGIRASVNDVKRTLLEGAALTILIVFLFLKSWRSTVITGLTLPIALVGTFLAMYAMGFTLNTMTLMALSLSVGLLIDDAIVVRENIVRHLAMGKSHFQAALEGTEEIGLAVMATTFTIVAVFIPVAFMGGIIGRFFLQFGVSVAAAVLLSLFVSFTLDPMLSSLWPDPHPAPGARKTLLNRATGLVDSVMDALHRLYGRVLAWALRRRKIALTVALASFLGSFALVPLIGSEFVPEADLGEAQVNIKTPVGSSLDYTLAKTRQAEAALREFAEVDATYATVNSGAAVGKNSAQIYVHLVPRKQRKLSQGALQQPLRERLARIGGIEVSVGTPGGMGGGKPIQVSLLGPDIEQLGRIAEEVKLEMAGIRGATDIDSSLEAAKPTLAIDINRDLASDLGVGVDQIGSALRPLVAGTAASTWKAPDGESYDVQVRLPRDQRTSAADLKDIAITSSQIGADGSPRMVPLQQVAQFTPIVGASRIDRKNLRREVLIGANASGRPAGDIGADLGKLLKTIDLPAGYSFSMGGSNKDMQETLGYAAAALALAVIFIYLILASQFKSFLQPIAIMSALPLSLVGVFLALLATGSTLNIFSIIGFIMLMGLVTKNAILLVDFANQAVAAGKSRIDALLEAGQVRLRPILMTTAAMIFGMLPMALGLGEGGSQRSPMAHAVIGGLITSTLLTLIVVPVIYTYTEQLGAWVLCKFRSAPAGEALPMNSQLAAPAS
ncbi:MAG: efflux RND transporter permease subunit [Burkholderiaceae bacterium]